MNYDPRLVVLTSRWPPVSGRGGPSRFDNPEKYGYKLRARTFEEHRERMILPSWKHIMNYESTSMSVDEMVDATYDARAGPEPHQGRTRHPGRRDGGRHRQHASARPREQMNRLDDVLYNGTGRIARVLVR